MAFLWRRERLVEVPGTGVRVLAEHEWGQALELCARNGADGTLAYAHIVDAMAARQPSGEVWGRYEGAELRSICWAGGNIEPVGITADEASIYAELALKRRAQFSLVGNAEAVLGMWKVLEKSWSPREVRPNQLLMEIQGPARGEADPYTRQGTPSELDLVFPASVAMFNEEVGISPMGWAEGYRARVRMLLQRGDTYIHLSSAGSQVLFKADLGSHAGSRVQVQGVWTEPGHRGRGLCTKGMAAVVNGAQARGIASVSLYVNDYNAAARKVYDRIGFEPIGRWATVML